MNSLVQSLYSRRTSKNGEVNLSFRNLEQEVYFWSTFRNNCFSGGFGNGKTYVACMRQFVMLQQFPGYISLFARQYYKDLKATTMKTFFKICPEDFVLSHDVKEGVTVFKNGSVALWIHLDAFDEQSLRGLEINSGSLDQVEEIAEAIYLVLDSRIGRWDGAKVPEHLLLNDVPEDIWKSVKLAPDTYTFEKLINEPKLEKIKNYLIDNSSWPKAPDGRPRVRNFLDVLCNPDNEFHWVYRRYHPNSIERKKNHFYIEKQTDDSLNDPETIESMKDRDPEWVDKYYKGIWGKSAAQIHRIHPLSIIDPEKFSKEEFFTLLNFILNRGSLYRCMDHGETAPTCVLWFAAINRIHICFREYYVPDQGISFHRESIWELSKNPFSGLYEEYEGDIADPSIFYKTKRSEGGKNNIKTSVADEYADEDIDGIPIFWLPGDNNELATRNRINELLRPNTKWAHPITKESPAPGLYFIKKSDDYPNGCVQSILQLQKQRREAIGTDNGRTIYSDNREESVEDHAYDPTRYYVAEHSIGKRQPEKEPPRRSFAYFEKVRLQKHIIIPN